MPRLGGSCAGKTPVDAITLAPRPTPLAPRPTPLALCPSPHAPRDRGDGRVGRSLSPTELVSRAPGRSRSARAWSSGAQRRSRSARAWSSDAQRWSLTRTGLAPGCTAPVALTQGAALLVPGNATSRVLIGETRKRLGHAERVTGIEPALSAWEAEVLPLNYTREHSPDQAAIPRDRRCSSERGSAYPLPPVRGKPGLARAPSGPRPGVGRIGSTRRMGRDAPWAAVRLVLSPCC